MKYYKSNDNHLYKVGEFDALHVNKGMLMINVIHIDVFEETREDFRKAHAPMREIEPQEFVEGYNTVMYSIHKIAYK